MIDQNDSISRQAAIGTLDDEITITGMSNAFVIRDYVQRVKRKLEDLPPAEPKVIQCKDCKHFSYDVLGVVDGIPLIVGHEMCDFWGDGCKTSENGWCSYAERKKDNGKH